MKITVFMGPWFPVPTVQGGSTHRLWHGLAEQFAAQGHHVTLVCRSYPGQARREQVNGVTYLRRSGFAQSASTALNLLKDFIYGLVTLPLVPRADILVVNDFWFPLLASLFRRKAGRIVINVNRFPKKQLFLYKGAALFAAASGAIREAIEAQTPEAGTKTRVFPNPIDTQTFHPPNARPPVSEKGTILYVGRLHPEKGLTLLLDAFAILSKQFAGLKLKILGPVKPSQGGAGEDFLHALKEKAAGLNVEFAAPVFELKELAEVYRRADLFCYPSVAEKGEAFGVAPLEAMATGLVPVVSNLGCFKDFINADESGLSFDHRAPDAAQLLADKLAFALRHPERTSEMSRKAVERASSFSYEKVARLYLSDFEELLRGDNLTARTQSPVALAAPDNLSR